ncbi:hypothetical protein LRB60_05025 [Borreliella burgdorferi]|nr:hypothetical protein [Borreliella burgdorferi]MCD2415937.1 hypothetical protein [Borreliella burgdorferi]
MSEDLTKLKEFLEKLKNYLNDSKNFNAIKEGVMSLRESSF